MTFEILEDCCAKVVIGDSILWEHNVFEDDAYSMVDCTSESEIYSLAPFDVVKNWQRKLGTVKDRITRSRLSNTAPQLHSYRSRTDINQTKTKKRIETIATPSKTDDGRLGTINTRSARQHPMRRNWQSDNADWTTIWR